MSESRFFVKGLSGRPGDETETEVWILRRTPADVADEAGAWVCTAITKDQEDAGENIR